MDISCIINAFMLICIHFFVHATILYIRKKKYLKNLSRYIECTVVQNSNFYRLAFLVSDTGRRH